MEVMNHLIFDEIIGISPLQRENKKTFVGVLSNMVFYIYTKSNRIPIESQTFVRTLNRNLQNVEEAKVELGIYKWQLQYCEEYKKVWAMKHSVDNLPAYVTELEYEAKDKIRRINGQIQAFKAHEN